MMDLEKKAVFLAGYGDRAEFKQAEVELYEFGAWFVFNPCEHWRKDDKTCSPWTKSEFLRQSIHLLTSGAPNTPQFDMVVLLDGSNRSELTATHTIRAVAKLCGMEVWSMAGIKARLMKDFWEGK